MAAMVVFLLVLLVDQTGADTGDAVDPVATRDDQVLFERLSNGEEFSTAELRHMIGLYRSAAELFPDDMAATWSNELNRHPPVSAAAFFILLMRAPAHYSSGKLVEAERDYRRALAIARNIGAAELVRLVQNDLGVFLQGIGRYAEAEPLLRAVAFSQGDEADPLTVAKRRHNLSGTLTRQGKYVEALALAQEALDILKANQLGETIEAAAVMQGLAIISLELGDTGTAMTLSLEVARIAKGAGAARPDLLRLAVTHGGWLSETGRHAEAVAWLQALSEEVHGTLPRGHPLRAALVEQLAYSLAALDRHVEAEELYVLTVATKEATGGRYSHGYADRLAELGVVYFKQGKRDLAETVLEEASFVTAISVDRALELPDHLSHLARIADSRGPLPILLAKMALNHVQDVRANLSTVPTRQQITYLSRWRQHYLYTAGLLIEQDRIAEARTVLSMLKEQDIFESIGFANTPSAGQLPYSPLEERWRDRFETIFQDARPRLEELRAMDAAALSTEPAPAALQHRAQLLQQLGSAQTQYASALDAADSRLLAVDTAHTGYIDSLNEQDETGSRVWLEQLASSSRGEKPAWLRYVPLGDRLVIILDTTDRRRVREVMVDRAALSRWISDFREGVQQGREVKMVARQLFDVLILPIAAELRASQADVLMLALTEDLRYLPFAALHDGKQWLIENYLPVMVSDDAEQQPWHAKRARTVAVFGTSHAIGGNTVLPSVSSEIAAIRGLRGLAVSSWEDQQFDRSRLLDLIRRGTDVLHIASHFRLDVWSRGGSRLLLGDGSTLSLADFARIDLAGISLLTLSACATGLGGGREEDGREMEGFGALARRQGVNAVLASLWPVADQSTSILMAEFYGNWQAGRLSKARALHRAQLALIRGTNPAGSHDRRQRGATAKGRSPTPAATVDADRPYAHPFHWASFVLQGNWL